MKLVNFELSKPSHGIELIGLGFVWDLHNAADFLGIHVNPNDNTAVMHWSLSAQAHPATKYSGCNLNFSGLRTLIISPRGEELSYSEDLCVSAISKITPEPAAKTEYRTKREWARNDPFYLWFEFQSRRSIEVDSEAVELIALPRAHPIGS